MTERLRTHFEKGESTHSQSILLELMTILGKYRDHIYLVGGWAPYYLLKLFKKPGTDFEHIGSIDIDLAIDFSKITDQQYELICDLLGKRNYTPRKNRFGQAIPFAFEKKIKNINIAVDFLAGEYGGTGKKHRHQRVQDGLMARKARGADLLPTHHLTFELEGMLPEDGQNRCEIKMANIVSALAMKGITIGERYKEKDAYDIFALLAYYKNGPESCMIEIKPHLKNSLVKEGVKSICEKFSEPNSAGVNWTATFMEPDNAEAQRIRKAEVYQKILPFIERMRG